MSQFIIYSIGAAENGDQIPFFDCSCKVCVFINDIVVVISGVFQVYVLDGSLTGLLGILISVVGLIL